MSEQRRRWSTGGIATILAVPAFIAAAMILGPDAEQETPAGGATSEPIPTREAVEPEEVFAVFRQPQDADDRLPARALEVWGDLIPTTARKVATFEGFDYFLAQVPYQPGDGTVLDPEHPRNLVCLVGVPRDRSRTYSGGCTMAMHTVGAKPSGPMMSSAGTGPATSLWEDTGDPIEPEVHVGWVFLTDYLAVTSENDRHGSWWKDGYELTNPEIDALTRIGPNLVIHKSDLAG